jgi:transcriptional regulator with XRE-family HTH domain
MRRFARELVGYRESAGFDPAQLAQKLEFSKSKITRIEAGEVRVSILEVLGLLGACGITDEDEIGSILDRARTAYKPRGNADYNGVISQEYRRYLEHEAVATEIAVYRPLILPRFLQTQAYAEAVDARTPGVFTRGQSEADRTLIRQLETQRAEWLLGQRGPDGLRIILGAAALEQSRYDGSVSALQRLNTEGRALSDLDDHLNPHIIMQIAPNLPGSLLAGGHAFDILHGDEGPIAMRTEEPGTGPDGITYDLDYIQSYQDAFDSLASEIPRLS